MKKVFWTLLVAALPLVSCDNKTTAPATETAEVETQTITGGDIAFVRVDYVLAQSQIYQTEGVALKDKTEKAQNAWAQKEKNLQYEASQLQEKYQKGLITTADAQKQQQSIEKKIANYQSSAQKEAQTLDEENYVFSNRTQDLIMRAIKEINADKKYKLIINATAQIDTVQPEIRYDAFVESYAATLNMCLQGIVSPATLGIDVGKMSSAEAQREKKDITGMTRNAITDALEKVLPQVVCSMLMTYDLMHSNQAGAYEPKVTFGEYGAPDFDSRVQTIASAATASVMSVEAQVDELWGASKDDDWKRAEVQRILELDLIASLGSVSAVELLEEAARTYCIPVSVMERNDETAPSRVLESFALSAPSLSMLTGAVDYSTIVTSDTTFAWQSATIRRLAKEGPCVIIGRCADHVLRGTPGVVSLFLYADYEARVDHITQKYQLSRGDATILIDETEKERARYYKRHTGQEFARMENYDLCLNTASVNREMAILLLKAFVENQEN